MRSVFVSQLSARVGEPQLTQFLETNVGPVRDARIIVDRISRRSKGSVPVS
jgi:RNA-binding protein 39